VSKEEREGAKATGERVKEKKSKPLQEEDRLEKEEQGEK